MNKTNRNTRIAFGKSPRRGARLGATTAGGTSCSCTPRPSAMRLMTRVVAGKKAAAVLSLAELRQDRFSNRLPGEAVGDEPFESVSDLDPDFAILDRDDDQEPVVLAHARRCRAPGSRTS